jgi:hypothetical protein
LFYTGNLGIKHISCVIQSILDLCCGEIWPKMWVLGEDSLKQGVREHLSPQAGWTSGRNWRSHLDIQEKNFGMQKHWKCHFPKLAICLKVFPIGTEASVITAAQGPCGCCKTVTKPMASNHRNLFSHSSGGQNSEIKVRGQTSWGDRTGDPMPSLSQILLAAGFPWLVATLLNWPLSSHCLFLCMFLSKIPLPFAYKGEHYCLWSRINGPFQDV